MKNIYKKITCFSCGNIFKVKKVPHFRSRLVIYCEKCGQQKVVWAEDIGIGFLPFVLGTDSPPGSPPGKWVKNYKFKGITRDQWWQAVSYITGKCKCGGSYTRDATPRCPKCGSDLVSPEWIG
jgi:hypothetical protein